MWDQRYNGETYAYGTEPNAFLVSMLNKLPEGRMLGFGEGEGGNARWLVQEAGRSQRWIHPKLDWRRPGGSRSRAVSRLQSHSLI